MDPAGLRLERLRAGLVEHPDVVGGLEPPLDEERLDLGLLHGVLELVGPVCRVDVHHDGADLCRGELGEHPFRVVQRPYGDPVPALHVERHEGACQNVDALKEFRVSPADVLVNGDERIAVRMRRRDSVQHLTDGDAEQGYLRVPTRVTALNHSI